MSPEERGKTLWAALSKSKDAPVEPGGMVGDLFGLTPRGGPNTKAAAEALGVSQRTVQRWIQQGLPKRSRTDVPEQLKRRHQAWRKGPGGRRAAMSTRREARLRNKGTTVNFLGNITISADKRKRSTSVPLSGEQMSRLLDAAMAGDDLAAHEALENAFGDAFGGSVQLEIDGLETYR